MANGTYSTATNGEIFPLSVHGNLSNTIYITGRHGAANAIIDAAGSGHDVIDVFKGSLFSLSGVTVQGGNYGVFLNGGSGNLWYIGASISDSNISNNARGIVASYTYGEISHNAFSGNTTYGIYYSNSTAKIIQNSFAFNCTGGTYSYDAAIYLDSSSPYIANNLIAWNNGSGIYASNSNPLILNNSIWINYGGNGIAVFNSSDPTIANNIITSNGFIGIHADSLDASQNTHNDVWGNGYSDYYGTSAGLGSISKDPRFASVFDAHLLCSSPAINAGDNNWSPTDDYDGNPRPIGSIVDMGAYEKQSDLYCPIYLPIIFK